MCSMLDVNKKSIQFLKSNRGRPDEQASYAICVRGRREGRVGTNDFKLTVHKFVRIVCVNVGQSSGRSSWQAGRTGRLHGICTVTQKDVILMPISGSTAEIVIATMSSTCGRLKIQEKKKPSLSPISGHANKSHLLKNHVLCRTLVLIYQNLALGFNFFL
ncbi:unnamed protein product [Leuciscus chuanchicus]